MKAHTLTEEDRQQYIAASGQFCPYCKQHDIQGGAVDIDGNIATQEVDCLTCGETWTDVYTLSAIEEVL